MSQESFEKPLRLYIAGPLFSKAERDFNKRLKQILSPHFSVYLPQEDGGLMVNMIAEGIPPKEAARQVFATDVDAMETCDILLIILDGRTVDEGAAFELGFAFARGKHCVALRTDPRQLLATGNNPMIESPLRETFTSVEILVAWARKTTEATVPTRGASVSAGKGAVIPHAEQIC